MRDRENQSRQKLPGGRREEMNRNPLRGAFQNRTGEEISGPAEI
jgi:hypothetical protein